MKGAIYFPYQVWLVAHLICAIVLFLLSFNTFLSNVVFLLIASLPTLLAMIVTRLLMVTWRCHYWLQRGLSLLLFPVFTFFNGEIVSDYLSKGMTAYYNTLLYMTNVPIAAIIISTLLHWSLVREN